MGFVVLHMEKAHGSDSGTTAHIERFIIPKNADPTRTHLNRRLIEYPDGVKDRSAAIQRRLEEAGLTRKIGSNQVRAIRINVSGTHEDMKRIEEEGRLDEWCADNLKYFADTFGKENIVAAHLHRDEETPHIHVTLVPIVKGERKRRKREEQTKKRYRKKPTDTVRLCADDIMTRLKLKSYQDTYAEAMAKYGLQRGIDGSKARHKSTQQYYRDIQKLSDDLKAAEVERKHRREITDKDTRHKQEISFLKTVIAKAAAWFPYFREMLRIENLCRLVGFDERQTATLVKGKPLEYAGELYSEEHGRKFTTEKAGFQVVKDPTDGTRLVLAVDRKPIAEWFKEQFDKLRQNIRRPIQPQRKSRGMKL